MKPVEHILLIDDDIDDNLFHETIIKQAVPGATLHTITDSRKALACWQKTANQPAHVLPAIIFLDINMPALTGFELLDEICKIPETNERLSTTKIFILSTAVPYLYATSLVKHGAIIAGCYSKPLTAEIIQEILRDHFA